MSQKKRSPETLPAAENVVAAPAVAPAKVALKPRPKAPAPAVTAPAAVVEEAPAPAPVEAPVPVALPVAEAPVPAKAKKPAKTPKVKKTKLVRDSYAMPEAEYALIAELKKRLVAMGVEVKKSELLRGGIAALAALDDPALKAVLAGVERIKTGRPSKK